MKHTQKFADRLWLLALVTVFGMAIGFAGCPSDGGGGDDDNNDGNNNGDDPAHTHTWGEWNVEAEGSFTATCMETGIGSRVCTVCGETDTNTTIPIDANAHDWKQLEGIAPTCTETGSGTRECNICEKEESLDVIPALGHVWKVWAQTTAPTCEAAGIKTRDCTVCNVTDTEKQTGDNALGHNYGEWVRTAAKFKLTNESKRTCSRDAEHEEIDTITLAAYLTSLPANTADTPVDLPMEMDIENMGSNWGGLLGALGTGGKFVNLDLSACTMTGSGNSFSFAAGNAAGKARIVTIALPDTAVSIRSGSTSSEGAFAGFTALKSFSGTGLKTIGNYAFSNRTSLTMTSLPSGVTSIGYYTFQGCTNLALNSLPTGVDSIGYFAFRNCTKLALNSLPTGVTAINTQTFDGCTGLTQFTLHSGITTILAAAFENCDNLVSVKFECNITNTDDFWSDAFPGDLRTKYFAAGGGIGTYTRPNSSSTTWTKG
jgi:hypothetical protein